MFSQDDLHSKASVRLRPSKIGVVTWILLATIALSFSRATAIIVDDKCQAVASPAHTRTSQDGFRLDEMIRTTSSMIPDD